MQNFSLFVFFGSVLLILHTYCIYPLCMILFFSKKKKHSEVYSLDDEMPEVAVLVAAYNEEKVIGEKIRSVLHSDYPSSKIKILIGSDASTDQTDQIIEALSKSNKNVELVKFKGRVGKIEIINHLSSLCEQELFILTDANVIFKPSTIYQLVKSFKDSRVGMVAANIIKESDNNDGISFQEKKYLSIENRIKAAESNAFQLILGAEGGCYAIRRSLFARVPHNFIVDDFYMTLKVLNNKREVLFEEEAICLEDVASDITGEYKRKVRISSGNFQNLFFFKSNLWPIWRPLPFAFWSHKVLRWFTPFFLLFCFVSSAFLAIESLTFLFLLLLQAIGLLFPLFNYLFRFKSPILKFISHFFLMNFALLKGFMNFTSGIKSSVWQPTSRNV